MIPHRVRANSWRAEGWNKFFSPESDFQTISWPEPEVSVPPKGSVAPFLNATEQELQPRDHHSISCWKSLIFSWAVDSNY